MMLQSDFFARSRLFAAASSPACVFSGPVYAPVMNNNTTTLSFTKEEPWRIFRIMAEFEDSFEVMSRVGPGVTVFGSALTPSKHPCYQATVTLAKELAQHNHAVITGRAPGIL